MKSSSGGQNFCKEERLTSIKAFAQLFTSGKSLLAYPVKVVWAETSDGQPYPAKVAFSASRRNFTKAADRNLIKRRMKEAYRLNKSGFYHSLADKQVQVVFLYIAKEILPYPAVEKSIVTLLRRLAAGKGR